ncbi:MAG TPA: threonine--tRNA ligase [Candidatus Dormibacteraeota bacterium]|nr:threonine--tRNA ligase [Candidatus Dormibacteraeota bacterium]
MLDVAEEVNAPDSLYVLRHSCAHVLAAAVTELWPGTKYAIGPPIENGFYYDFEFPEPISETDFRRIEKKMAEIIRKRVPFEQVKLPREEAIARFRELNQPYKLEILDHEAKDDEIVSCYRTGDFFDLCRGPHVADAGEIKAFKLLKVAGAYWRGDEHRQQLTRIYATAWPSAEEQQEYLQALEEAERRDHKRLGRELGLFALDERCGPGLVLWLPNGATVRRELERWVVDEELARGYQHVITPVMAKLDLYKQSGHWQKYHDSMFPPMVTPEGEEYELRPMNCPHHILIYQQGLHSYRDLPMRIAEIGNMYRYEKSGELMGMIRVRSIALNDAHIFCTPEQLHQEILGVIDLANYFMRTLGVDDYTYRLSVRDKDGDKWVGEDEQWRNAEEALAGALDSVGAKYVVGTGEAAFYGPKIDFQVRDAQRREFTNNTIQVDFQLPERFGLEYVAADGSRQRPVMIHRGAFGAMERMTAYLIEHWAGAFPTWLAPQQVAVLPITDVQQGYAHEVADVLRRSRVRVRVDDSSERVGKKIRQAQAEKTPYMLVVGAREAEEGKVSVRTRSGEQFESTADGFRDRIIAEITERRLG